MVRCRHILLLVGLGMLYACDGAPGSSGSGGGASAKTLKTPTEWPSYRGDMQMAGVASGWIPDQWELAWEHRTGGSISSSAVVAGGVVYIGSGDGHLYALALDSGQVKWKTLLGKADDLPEVVAPPLVLAGRVLVGNSEGKLYALDRATGNAVWSFATEGEITGAANYATLSDGRSVIVFGSHDGNVYCLTAEQGEEVWRFTTEDFINGSPAIDPDLGLVVFGGCDGKIYALEIDTGEPFHTIDIEHPNQGTVALRGKVGFIGHHGQAFVAVDLESGQVDWTYTYRRASFVSPAAVNKKLVVFGGRDRNVHAVNRVTGSSVWRFTTEGNVDSAPLIIGDRVVVGSSDGHLYMLSMEDGAKVWSYRIGQPITAAPAIASGHLIIGSEDGSVYVFRPKEDSKP